MQMEEINIKLDCKRKQIPKQANDKLTVLFPMYLNFIACSSVTRNT